MTIEELAGALPNGLHDAFLLNLNLDYENRCASLVLDIWVGNLEATSIEVREQKRRARLCLLGLEYLIVDPPDSNYPYQNVGSVRIDLINSDPAITESRALPDHGFSARFFVFDWNAFIHFAAISASLTWLDPA